MTNLPVPVWATAVVPGGFDTAALMNTVGNNGTFLTNRPHFQGYQASAQSIPATTLTAIAIDTTAVDTYGGHSNVTNNSRYTVQTGGAGWYRVTVSLGFVVSGTGSRLIEIHKNGVAPKMSQNGTDCNGVAIGAAIQCTVYVQLAVGDYVEGFAYQTTAGALNTSPTQTGMTVVWEHA
ncbi:hypothetical protein KCMC57_64020 (plasmid) [Kitasatospora sp. CMC57]|uniref:Uncharacterized protein n=1 Tax=Kitasatospora sp. CMC57 TaxID=3231513 RepID=A0AB33K983_9ACTN